MLVYFFSPGAFKEQLADRGGRFVESDGRGVVYTDVLTIGARPELQALKDVEIGQAIPESLSREMERLGVRPDSVIVARNLDPTKWGMVVGACCGRADPLVGKSVPTIRLNETQMALFQADPLRSPVTLPMPAEAVALKAA